MENLSPYDRSWIIGSMTRWALDQGIVEPGVALALIEARDKVEAHMVGCYRCRHVALGAIANLSVPKPDDLCGEVPALIDAFGRLRRRIVTDEGDPGPAIVWPEEGLPLGAVEAVRRAKKK